MTPEKFVAHQKSRQLYADRTREEKQARDREYAIKNSARLVAKTREWRKNNPEKHREIRRRHENRKRAINPVFSLKRRLRGRIYHALKDAGFRKQCSSVEILGCSFEFLKNHIESQFLPGMSWESRNLWHVDHRKPLASAQTEGELLALCHYTNLQPLWAGDNIRKSDRQP